MSRWREAVRALLKPRSIAIVGANPAHPVRGMFLGNLHNFGFRGAAYGISPRAYPDEPFPYFENLNDAPDVPEVVVAAVGASRIAGVVQQAAELGVKATIICDGGFADSGADGKALQDELAAIATRAGMALLGPNCYGIANLAERAPIYLMPLNAKHETGRFAAIAASGSFLDTLACNQRGVVWSHLIATGNEAVLGPQDFLDHFATDPDCDGVAMFIETVRQPDAFFAACDAMAAAGKPIVLLRGGVSQAGQASALAHSGALAPPARLLAAKLRRHNVIAVDSIEELLCATALLQVRRTPISNRIAILTASGGLMELMQDVLEPLTLETPAFAQATQDALKAVAAPVVKVSNPLDWWSGAGPQELAGILKVVVSDPNVDTVVTLDQSSIGPAVLDMPLDLGYATPQLMETASATDKLLIALDPNDVSPSMVRTAAAAGVAVLGGFSPSLRALAHVAAYHASRARRVDDVATLTTAPAPPSGAVSGKRALDFIGVAAPSAPTHLVKSVDELKAALNSLSFPMVVKSGDEDDLHKTEKQALRLNLRNEAEALQAARDLFALGCKSLLAQQQIAGVELLLGVKDDPMLGQFLVVGLGGIWTEILDDVAIRPLGVGRAEARAMLEGLKGAALLKGARGQAAVDMDAAIDAICGLDALARASGGKLKEVDINPLVLSPDGAFAVDALVVAA